MTNVEWAKEILKQLEDKSHDPVHVLLDLMSKVHKAGFTAGVEWAEDHIDQ